VTDPLEVAAIEKLIDDSQQEGREQAAREIAREANRVHDLGGEFNRAVAVGLDAAARLIRRTPDPGAAPDPDRPWLICWAEHRGMLCDRKRDHDGDHVDIYGPLPRHTWAAERAERKG
jgi:hypothetical protein